VTDGRGPLVAFLGPSLPAEAARAIVPEVVLLPPVTQGDFSTVVERMHPHAVLIVDGEFAQSLSVWHKEILAALVAGIRVVGASSMGALRAAELDRFGMEGVGAIYAHYRDGWLTEDADVALLHGDAESGYRPLTWPLVNVRATLGELVRQDLLDRDEAGVVEGAASALHFAERTALALQERLIADGLDPARARALVQAVRTHHVDQKAIDAVAGFEHLARLDEIPRPHGEVPLHTSGRGFLPLLSSDVSIEHRGTAMRRYQVVNDVGLHLEDYEDLLARALDRQLIRALAADVGVVPDAEELADERARLLDRLGTDEDGLADWCVANDLDADRFADLVRHQAVVRRMRRWLLDAHMYERSRGLVIQQLQLEGRYEAAVAAAAQRRRLAQSRDPVAHPMTEAEVLHLASRHSARTGWRPRPSMAAWADEFGFDGMGGLVVALCDADTAGRALNDRRERVARLFGIELPSGPATASGAPGPVATPGGPSGRPRILRPGDPGRTHALLEAHQVTQVLLVAVELGVPAALARGPLTVAELAAATSTDADRLERLMRALQATAMATVDAERWSLTADGRALLPGDDGLGLDDYARDIRSRVFADWAGLAEVIRGGDPPGYPVDATGDRAIAAATTALGLVDAVIGAVPLPQGARVVDIGGGMGGLAERLAAARPDLRVAVLELPETAARARQHLAGRGLGETIAVIDFVGQEALDQPVECCLLERVLVTLDDAGAVALLGLAGRSLVAGGAVEVIDLQADGSAPSAFGDLLNLARSGGGVRTVDAWEALAARAGLRLVETAVVRPPFVRLSFEPVASEQAATS
jgi:hypothetical protein